VGRGTAAARGEGTRSRGGGKEGLGGRKNVGGLDNDSDIFIIHFRLKISERVTCNVLQRESKGQ